MNLDYWMFIFAGTTIIALMGWLDEIRVRRKIVEEKEVAIAALRDSVSAQHERAENYALENRVLKETLDKLSDTPMSMLKRISTSITTMIVGFDPDEWTTDLRPKVTVLEKRMGQQISEQQRNLAYLHYCKKNPDTAQVVEAKMEVHKLIR